MRRIVTPLVGLSLLVLTVAACGGGSGSSTGSSSASAPATSVTITVYPQGRAAAGKASYQLSCSPPAGTVPDPAAACAAAGVAGAFDPVPADAACTMIYGGPEEAHVVGTVDGQPVDAWFNRSGGCEIARWDRLKPLLPLPAA